MKQVLFSFALIIAFSCSNKQQTEVGNTEFTEDVATDTSLPLKEKYSSAYLFTGIDPDVYSANIPLQGHTLKKGDKVEAINAANIRVLFLIEKIMVGEESREELKTGETGYIDFKRLEGSVTELDGDFYFVDQGASYPIEAPTVSPTSTNGNVSLLLNGKPWTGAITYQGALLYKGGLKMMDPSGKPYMQLAFISNQKPDDRQFTITIKDFPSSVGVIQSTGIEILLSGSETGDSKKSEMIGYKADYTNYSVELNITKWEFTSADIAVMSATFAAKLKGVMGSPDATVADGKLENISVTVYKDPY